MSNKSRPPRRVTTIVTKAKAKPETTTLMVQNKRQKSTRALLRQFVGTSGEYCSCQKQGARSQNPTDVRKYDMDAILLIRGQEFFTTLLKSNTHGGDPSAAALPRNEPTSSPSAESPKAQKPVTFSFQCRKK